MTARHVFETDAEGYCWQCGESRVHVRHVLAEVDDAAGAYLAQTVNFGDVSPGLELAERDAFAAGWEARDAVGDVTLTVQGATAVEQIAMYTNGRDALAYGRPAWDKLSPDAREEYLRDAGAMVRAFAVLGWSAPAEVQP